MHLEDLQILDGRKTWQILARAARSLREEPFVAVKIYEVPTQERWILPSLAEALDCPSRSTREWRLAADPRQRRLAESLRALDYGYRCERTPLLADPKEITVRAAARAVLAVWRERPHEAKYRTADHFDDLYQDIFTEDLKGSQVALAVQLLCMVERRGRGTTDELSGLLRHGAEFVAMLMGRAVLGRLGMRVGQLDREALSNAQLLLTEEGGRMVEDAVRHLEDLLRKQSAGRSLTGVDLASLFLKGELTGILG